MNLQEVIETLELIPFTAEIDYSEGLEGSQFVIRNPNATSTCGCGSSFSA